MCESKGVRCPVKVMNVVVVGLGLKGKGVKAKARKSETEGAKGADERSGP